MGLRVAFLVELRTGEPWNEDYKNLAKYIYDTLKARLIQIL